jgi:hypothetical protein
MKVLWITSEYRPRTGGIERYVETTTRQLSESLAVSLISRSIVAITSVLPLTCADVSPSHP